jgi:hypothetical protein
MYFMDLKQSMNKLLTLFTLLSFLSWTIGCSTSTIVTNWNALPKERPIKVTTKAGAQYTFEKWRINADSSVLSMTQSPQRIIPSDSIVSIASIDHTENKGLKTSLIVAGCIGGVLLLLWIWHGATGFHFPKI